MVCVAMLYVLYVCIMYAYVCVVDRAIAKTGYCFRVTAGVTTTVCSGRRLPVVARTRTCDVMRGLVSMKLRPDSIVTAQHLVPQLNAYFLHLR